MKKYLLLLCLMAIVQIGFASTDMPTIDHKINSDSVIVEFGKSGKVVIIVNNKEDFEKLKSMNINEIIRELDLKQNGESGELTIVQIQKKDGTSKDIVRVNEDGMETEV